MAMTKHWAVFLHSLFLICIAGCVDQVNPNSTGNQMPSEWLVEIPRVKGECVSLHGDYLNHGLGKTESYASFIETRLDAALGHTYPSERMPDLVTVSVEKGTNSISILFGSPANESFSMNARCSDGWYQIEQTRSKQYVGDGTNLDFAKRKVMLRKANDGDLLIHLILEAQFSSFAVIKATEKREIWSKYRMVTQEQMEDAQQN